ncbi:hypothetical protein ABW20_dc0102779 [Dactylellina cionopaga]|nr:hypothetical protein ABW20_dc0102779 [Dactylellina cionopaga]
MLRQLSLSLAPLLAFPSFVSSTEIAFIHPDEWSPNDWKFQNLQPDGPNKCNKVVNTYEDRVSSIRLRTGYTDSNRVPNAIAFYHGKDCSRAVVKFVILYYNSNLVDQVFYLGELPDENTGTFTKYKPIEEGTLDWQVLLGGVSRSYLPLKEGDIVYKDGQGWKNLTNVVEVSAIPSKQQPTPERYDWYNKGIGLRGSDEDVWRLKTLYPDAIQIHFPQSRENRKLENLYGFSASKLDQIINNFRIL